MAMKKRGPCMFIIRKKSHEKVAKTRTVLVGIKGYYIGGISLDKLELG